MRQLELDIFADTKGGLYSHPAGPGLAAQVGLPADPDFDPDHIMDKPGFKSQVAELARNTPNLYELAGAYSNVGRRPRNRMGWA